MRTDALRSPNAPLSRASVDRDRATSPLRDEAMTRSIDPSLPLSATAALMTDDLQSDAATQGLLQTDIITLPPTYLTDGNDNYTISLNTNVIVTIYALGG